MKLSEYLKCSNPKCKDLPYDESQTTDRGVEYSCSNCGQSVLFPYEEDES